MASGRTINLKSRTVTLTGGAGSATGSATIPVTGFVHAVKLSYSGQPATCDVTLTDDLGSVILAKADSNTGAVYRPRQVASKAADGTASVLTEVLPAVARVLNIAVAQGNAGTVTVDVLVEE